MSRTGPAPRRHPLVPLRLAAVLLSIVVSGVSTPRAPAANYTYTIAGSVTNQWNSGTAGSWSSTPVSGSSTGLVFQGQLANGAVNTSHNDVPGTFTLNSLAISATGPSNGSSSFTISGNPLRFVVNSGTQPSAITVISGITIPAALISADIVLDDHLSSNVQPSTAVLTLSGTISGLGTFDKTGSGILVIGVGSVVNSFAGDTRIQAGSLSLGSPGALAGSTLDMNTADAGTLDFGTPATTYSLGGLKGSRAIAASDNTLSIGGNGQSTTYSGGITGTGGLTKTGTGGLTLTGTSGYSGPTTVTSGSLILDGRLTSSSVSVGPGGLFGGSGTVVGDVTVSGTLSPGSSPGSTGPLSVTGSVALGATATLLLDISSTSAFDEIVGSGSSFTNGGALVLSLTSSGTFANGTTLGLIHGFSTPHAGSFSVVSMLATGTYAGLNATTLSNTTFYGPNVWASDWVNSDGSGGNGQRVLFYQQTGEFVVVPEPSTAAMALAGLTLSAAVALRRRLRLRRRIR